LDNRDERLGVKENLRGARERDRRLCTVADTGVAGLTDRARRRLVGEDGVGGSGEGESSDGSGGQKKGNEVQDRRVEEEGK